MYLYDNQFSYAPSPSTYHGIGFLANGGGTFSTACDSTVATPAFSSAEQGKLLPILSVAQSTNAIKWNRLTHPTKSGIKFEDIITDLNRYVDFGLIRAAIEKSGGKYAISDGSVDALCVEAAHQFQAKVYFQADEQTGLVGPSTLDSLGIVKHKLRSAVGNVFGRGVVNAASSEISKQTNNEFDAKNWFDFIVAPSFLGHRINRQSQGIHLLLLRKLREAENYLLSLSTYSGMTPVSLGRALGLDKSTVNYSGGRLSSNNEAMHGVGLALDIDGHGNPWVGAGWINDDNAGREWLVAQLRTERDTTKTAKYQVMLNRRNERYRLMDVLRAGGRTLPNTMRAG